MSMDIPHEIFTCLKCGYKSSLPIKCPNCKTIREDKAWKDFKPEWERLRDEAIQQEMIREEQR